MRTLVRLWPLLVVSLCPGLAVPARAQDTEAMRHELTEVRRQLDSVREEYERRLRELTERLDQLESQRRAAPSASGSPPVATATASAPQPPAKPPAPLTATAAAAPTAGEPTIGEILAPRQSRRSARSGRSRARPPVMRGQSP